MPEYLAKLSDDRGQILKRVETAGSESELRDRYAQQGLLVYSIRRRTSLGSLRESGSRKKKVKLSEFLTFNQQFVTLIRAGLPILKSLDLLSGQIAQPSLRSSIEKIRGE